jgi:hypothetical protein
MFGEELRKPRDPISKNAKIVDIKTANYTYIRRMRTAEKLINFTKSRRHNKSMEEIEDRMELADIKVGDVVYHYQDRKPRGISKKLWIPWNGPFEVMKTTQTNLVIEVDGKEKTVSLTKIVKVPTSKWKLRGIDGKARQEEDQADEQIYAELKSHRLDWLKKRLNNLEESDLQSEAEEPEKEEIDKKEIDTLLAQSRIRPKNAKIYHVDDFKEGRLCDSVELRIQRDLSSGDLGSKELHDRSKNMVTHASVWVR